MGRPFVEELMINVITKPTVLQAAGTPPKQIEEYFGRINSGDEGLSVARMISPAGWDEPAQTPEFDEYTVVLRGILRVEWGQEQVDVLAGQAIKVGRGETVRYSTPHEGGAEYLAICLPAFSPERVHRQED